MIFFFLKQKTAYEVGLGIPAEPLFRSAQEMQQQDNHEYPFLYQRQTCHQVQPNQATRSEERRVGKECRYGGDRSHYIKQPGRERYVESGGDGREELEHNTPERDESRNT